jgi:tetratricopeptide (TPR) repeat protein
MMIERHYDDEALVTMLATGAGTADAHLTACGECTEKLDTFRLVTSALHDAATWDKREINEAPNPNTIATLRAFADSMSAEDTAAEAFLASLLAGPRESWMATLTAHPEYRTPGTVRRLIAATDRALDTMPADAVEITALAVEIAEKLDPPACRADTLARLRGGAWRERAYALFYTGRFSEAEKAVDTAQRHFDACVVDEYEQARVGIVGSLVERGMERLPEAIKKTAKGIETFIAFGDSGRIVSSKSVAASLQFSLGNYRDALRIWKDAERDCNDDHVRARILPNIAVCYAKTRDFKRTVDFTKLASHLYSELDMPVEAIRLRWNSAAMLAEAGRPDDALSELESVRRAFVDMSMLSEAALAALDAADIYLAREEFVSVERMCRDAMGLIEASGLEYSTRALTAIALLSDAAEQRKATSKLSTQVRQYVKRLPVEPTLLFAMPPA